VVQTGPEQPRLSDSHPCQNQTISRNRSFTSKAFTAERDSRAAGI